MSNIMKKWMPVAACIVGAFLVAYFFPSIQFANKGLEINAQFTRQESVIPQDVTDVASVAHSVTKIYNKSTLLGVISDKTKIDDFLKRVYSEKYRNSFPDSSISLGTDIYMTQESSYFVYEDVDDEILDYILSNELFSFEVTRIEFTNGAVVYVKNKEDFDKAKRQYLLNFIDEKALDLISVNQLPPELISYGERDIAIQVVEQATVSKGYASIDDIKMSVQDIIYFLSYGYGTEMETYSTVEYDTVEGVATKVGLSTQQLITLNSDKLKSSTQLLAVGTVLNTTFFKSPINVVVTKERAAKEIVYAPSPRYIPNSSLREGVYRTVVDEESGSKNVFYREVYVNGELSTYEVVSEEITLQPVQEVIEYGTLVIPGIGTGKFRYPVDNAKLTCRWYCYAGHTAIDVINRYEKYGNVKAADRGVIDEVGYNSVNGNYVWINHNNGFRTYYGHMNRRAYYSVGVKVNKGDVIGQIGRTGKATGPHVHFVIEYKGTRYNPCKYLGC